MSGFICQNCEKKVSTDNFIGTAFRNHCPFCLWSKHLGQGKTIDKVRPCQSMMEPIGLTFKQEGFDKFTKEAKQGEIMIVNQCLGCGAVTINRIAADDDPKAILKLLRRSFAPLRMTPDIKVLDEKDEKEVKRQLFGII
ncbi:RNHCP domain-containing protein [Candidatus Shapirobacteria bacterium CG08_land_8_20_14_0_20_39_18]|uniref:RNHCP domain-containing protein n=1 Tax=Candidatus Shapirobacteria bacterium CG08_land_8_20_14_0_20_39_18 TaxID=1974883 RepID=A0A2M6XDB3_9BACT|nr:MAG: RNHCP domain-containing protein [Candidatus Shapirobacteria bacterium CG08_land_8_20_14_0_20_39_18]PIY66170.1 MAG: RNHCP domain-containing protein [Candidatus Shapirobacteria bacterium CG_4_10_14_0_8_um_filter_39_15]PJE68872.1 MAG: RNHCP domain-containing protein [Candidatus Shapirobacteria bacterium CG10_big_fil_rev_8_21_14_0_10_38_8]